jgi:hypothetical protein
MAPLQIRKGVADMAFQKKRKNFTGNISKPIGYKKRSSCGGHTTLCYELYSVGEDEDLERTMG